MCAICMFASVVYMLVALPHPLTTHPHTHGQALPRMLRSIYLHLDFSRAVHFLQRSLIILIAIVLQSFYMFDVRRRLTAFTYSVDIIILMLLVCAPSIPAISSAYGKNVS